MKIACETRYPQEGVALVVVSGEVDVYTSPRLKEVLVDLLSRGRAHLVVDLDRVEFLDSTGLGVLMSGMRRAAEQEGSLKVLCSNPRHQRIFEITGLTTVFDVCLSEEEALRKLNGGRRIEQ
jgi:anti-sigma B factor antagonist